MVLLEDAVAMNMRAARCNHCKMLFTFGTEARSSTRVCCPICRTIQELTSLVYLRVEQQRVLRELCAERRLDMLSSAATAPLDLPTVKSDGTVDGIDPTSSSYAIPPPSSSSTAVPPMPISLSIPLVSSSLPRSKPVVIKPNAAPATTGTPANSRSNTPSNGEDGVRKVDTSSLPRDVNSDSHSMQVETDPSRGKEEMDDDREPLSLSPSPSAPSSSSLLTEGVTSSKDQTLRILPQDRISSPPVLTSNPPLHISTDRDEDQSASQLAASIPPSSVTSPPVASTPANSRSTTPIEGGLNVVLSVGVTSTLNTDMMMTIEMEREEKDRKHAETQSPSSAPCAFAVPALPKSLAARKVQAGVNEEGETVKNVEMSVREEEENEEKQVAESPLSSLSKPSDCSENEMDMEVEAESVEVESVHQSASSSSLSESPPTQSSSTFPSVSPPSTLEPHSKMVVSASSLSPRDAKDGDEKIEEIEAEREDLPSTSPTNGAQPSSSSMITEDAAQENGENSRTHTVSDAKSNKENLVDDSVGKEEMDCSSMPPPTSISSQQVVLNSVPTEDDPEIYTADAVLKETASVPDESKHLLPSNLFREADPESDFTPLKDDSTLWCPPAEANEGEKREKEEEEKEAEEEEVKDEEEGGEKKKEMETEEEVEEAVSTVSSSKPFIILEGSDLFSSLALASEPIASPKESHSPSTFPPSALKNGAHPTGTAASPSSSPLSSSSAPPAAVDAPHIIMKVPPSALPEGLLFHPPDHIQPQAPSTEAVSTSTLRDSSPPSNLSQTPAPDTSVHDSTLPPPTPTP